MAFTLVGLVMLSTASSFPLILAAAAMVGIGSAVFHPESSRVARMASGGQHGFAQSIFQVGGNAGSAAGPLLAAFIVLPHGQGSLAWFSLAALLGMALLGKVGVWAKQYRAARANAPKRASDHGDHSLPSKKVKWAIAILVALVFSKYVYLASLGQLLHVLPDQQISRAGAERPGVLIRFPRRGGAGDHPGRPDWRPRRPQVRDLVFDTGRASVHAGAPLPEPVVDGNLQRDHRHDSGSAFPAIVVYAQELLPGKLGMISGLFFGLAFGTAGIAAALLGQLADHTSIGFVYQACSFMPLLGLLAVFLPDIEGAMRRGATSPQRPAS